MRAKRPNQVWAIDFQFDETADGRRVKLANIVDEYTREALAMRVGRTCTADDLVEVLTGLVAVRGAPEHLRVDIGPELLAWALRDYCRLAGIRTTYIEPGAPMGEPLCRVVQRPGPRRAAQPRGIHQPDRRPGAGRGLADRVQRLPTPRRPWRPSPGRIRSLWPDIDSRDNSRKVLLSDLRTLG